MSFKQIFIKNKSYLSYQNNSMSVKNEFTNTLVCLDDIDIIPLLYPWDYTKIVEHQKYKSHK